MFFSHYKKMIHNLISNYWEFLQMKKAAIIE